MSFSNILRRIDENDNMGLQRQESYQYRGWNGLSSGKKRAGRRASTMVTFEQPSEDQKL
jgi:hypothetical protein